VQGSGIWTPPTGTLGRIVQETESRVEVLRRTAISAPEVGERPSFRHALSGSSLAVIAEVKRKSPSKGWLNAEMSVSARAREYANAGASALSILTEANHFDGSPVDLTDAREVVRQTPLLKKDFHIDPVQVQEAWSLGASALLLIVRALGPGILEEMLAEAESRGLDALVEIRTEDELRRAVDAGASIIGVNNRNLETLEIDPGTVDRILPLIPANCIAVAESGMSTVTDVQRAAAAGADAVLVGSSLSSSPDPAAMIRDFRSVHRVGRNA